MPDVHYSFFYGYDRRIVVIVHTDIKCGPAHGNYRCGGENPVVIGLSTQLLDMDFHPPNQNIQQVAPVSRILTKDDIGVRIDLKSTTIGNLELGIAVWTRDNDLPGLHIITDVESPLCSVAKGRYIAV